MWETTMSFGPGISTLEQFGNVGQNVGITLELTDFIHSVSEKAIPEKKGDDRDDEDNN